jgi:hypothetical protein
MLWSPDRLAHAGAIAAKPKAAVKTISLIMAMLPIHWQRACGQIYRLDDAPKILGVWRSLHSNSLAYGKPSRA